MEEESLFFRSYRTMIEAYRLAPEISALQLERILRRVRQLQSGEHPPRRAPRPQTRTQRGGQSYEG